MNRIAKWLKAFWDWLIRPERVEKDLPVHSALIVFPTSYFRGFEDRVRQYTLYLVHEVYCVNARPGSIDVQFRDNIDRPQAFFVCPALCADDLRITFENIMELVVQQTQPAASGYLPIDDVEEDV